MNRSAPFENGEIYHVYNRGAHKEKIFTHPIDYARFQLLLYLGNCEEKIHLGNLLTKYKGLTFIKIYQDVQIPDSQRFVDILAYTLMPNHFHLVLQQKKRDGIAKLLQKISTGYSMYFNKKYEHSGTLFQGTYKSKHVNSSEYLRWLFAYIYSNPTEIKKDIRKYAYSSFADVSTKQKRPEGEIIAWEGLQSLGDDHPTERDLIARIIKVKPL